MKTTTNPRRLVTVPFSKTQCGVDFYINTGRSEEIHGVLTENPLFRTDFFEFFVYRLLYCYQTDTPPWFDAGPEAFAEYLRLLEKIKAEIRNGAFSRLCKSRGGADQLQVQIDMLNEGLFDMYD